MAADPSVAAEAGCFPPASLARRGYYGLVVAADPSIAAGAGCFRPASFARRGFAASSWRPDLSIAAEGGWSAWPRGTGRGGELGSGPDRWAPEFWKYLGKRRA